MSDTPVFDEVVNPTPEPGFIARSRKAVIAGASAFAASAGALIIPATADGAFDFVAEGMPMLVVSLGLGVGTFFATWAVPNAGGK